VDVGEGIGRTVRRRKARQKEERMGWSNGKSYAPRIYQIPGSIPE